MTSLLVLADAGPGPFHVGDEATLEVNLAWLRSAAPDAELVVAGREAGAGELTAKLARASAALVSGGGNLSGSWPALTRQRLHLLREAVRLGVPVALGGQTLGPELGEQRAAVAEALAGAACVGVRDRPSVALAQALGVPATRLAFQVDDAWGLEPCEPAGLALPDAFLAVTLDGSFAVRSERVRLLRLASQLARLARETGLDVVFQPHLGPLGEIGDDDGAAGRIVGAALATAGVRCLLTPVLGPAETTWVTRRARLAVSSRFHPLVFAAAGAVPALGIHRDAYTRVKLPGALEHVGAEGWSLSVAAAERGDLADAGLALWEQRAAVSATTSAAHEPIARREAQRREHLAAVLGLAEPAGPYATVLPGAPGPTAKPYPTSRRTNESQISDEQWNDFTRDGYLRLGKVLEPNQVEALCRRADDLALGHVTNDAIRMQLDTGGEYEQLPEAVDRFDAPTIRYRKLQGLETDEVFWPLVTTPLFLDVCERSYGRHASVSMFRAMVMNKPAGQGTLLPWHQDGGDVWKLDRDPLVTIWVALDPATEANGCLEVVAGSHKLGLLTPEGSMLSDAEAAEHCPPERVRSLPVEAGHAVLLHNWLIHRSGINPSPVPRRAFTGCYMDGRTISTLTGDRFPVIHGTPWPEDYHFVEEMQRDRVALRESFSTCEEYALSLRAALDALEAAQAREPAPAAAAAVPAAQESGRWRFPRGPLSRRS